MFLANILRNFGVASSLKQSESLSLNLELLNGASKLLGQL